MAARKTPASKPKTLSFEERVRAFSADLQKLTDKYDVELHPIVELKPASTDGTMGLSASLRVLAREDSPQPKPAF